MWGFFQKVTRKNPHKRVTTTMQNVLYDLFLNEKLKPEPGTLYIVATPLGNIADITARALGILSGVDFVAAFDTRVTGRLLCHFGITKPMISYNEDNAHARGPEIAARLKAGESCALVTDAGTPTVSDPGEGLVRLCVEQNIPVTAVPGACAAITAIMLAGMPASRFSFEGDLGATREERIARLCSIAADRRLLVIYESPYRLKETLTDIANVLGTSRKIAVCRDLTKPTEEVVRTDVAGALEYVDKRPPRGDYVLVIEGSES